MSLNNRGFTHDQAGEEQRAIADYTTVIGLAGAPVEQVAMALYKRGNTHGRSGEAQLAIDDYTTLIGRAGAPTDVVARALLSRGSTQGQAGEREKARSDFEAVVRLPEAPLEGVVMAQLELSELHFGDGRWNDGFEALAASLERGEVTQPSYRGNATFLIGVVFASGLGAQGRREKVSSLLNLYDKHHALPTLGEALIQHIGRVFRAGKPFPSTDNLDGWAVCWEAAAENVPDFRLSVRLLRAGIEFVKTGGDDPGRLLDLTSPERAILEQAFGLETR